MASAAAGAATIRLAEGKMPSRWARSTASVTASERPESAAGMFMRRFGTKPPPRPSPSRGEGEGSGGFVAFTQELEEFYSLAEAALHHLRAADHLADDRGNLGGAEIEAAVEGLYRIKNLGVREMRVVQ